MPQHNGPEHHTTHFMRSPINKLSHPRVAGYFPDPPLRTTSFPYIRGGPNVQGHGAHISRRGGVGENHAHLIQDTCGIQLEGDRETTPPFPNFISWRTGGTSSVPTPMKAFHRWHTNTRTPHARRAWTSLEWPHSAHHLSNTTHMVVGKALLKINSVLMAFSSIYAWTHPSPSLNH